MKGMLPAILVAVGAAVGAGGTAAAGPLPIPALSLHPANVKTDFLDFSLEMGFQFTVNTPVTVTALGGMTQDLGILTGLTTFENVALWDSAGSQLASVFVPDEENCGCANLTGYYNYAAIEPISLAAGKTYTIAELGGEQAFIPFGDGSSFSTVPQITYTAAVSVEPPGAFVDPLSNEFLAFTDYLGPNFMIAAPIAPAPEPGSAALLGAGLLVLGIAARRQRQVPGRRANGAARRNDAANSAKPDTGPAKAEER